MKKSFKKSIAVLLAVLMVMFSFPFSAMAYYEDDIIPSTGLYPKANIGMRFGTFVDFGKTEDYTTPVMADQETFKTGATGIYGPPLIYDGTSLTLTKEMQIPSLIEQESIETAEDYDGDDSYTLEEGDMFTATFTVNGADKLFSTSLIVSYSDNIEPAYVYRSGTKKKDTKTTYGTKDQYEAALAADKAANKDVAKYTELFYPKTDGDLEDQDASHFYEGINTNADASGFSRKYKPGGFNKWDDNTVYISANNQEGEDYSDISSVAAGEGVTDPKTGEVGYTCEDDAILATFAFIITGDVDEENPIEFNVWDPTAEKNTNIAENFGYRDTKTGTSGWVGFLTYASSDLPGSTRLYFNNYNSINKDHYKDDSTPDVKPATVTFQKQEGDEITVISSKEYNVGDTIPAEDIPALPTKAPDDSATGNHYSYDWDKEIVTTVAEGGATYTAVQTATQHTFTVPTGNAKPATHTEDGWTEYKCSGCDITYKEPDQASGVHTFGDATVTLSDDAQTVTENRVCKEDDAKDTSAVTAINEVAGGKAATCTTNSTTKYQATVTYSDGKSYTSNIVEVENPDTALKHDYQYAWDWADDLSSAKLIVTCSRGDFNDEIEAKVTEEVTKEPTGTETGLKDVKATATFNGETKTDVKTDVVIPAEGQYTVTFKYADGREDTKSYDKNTAAAAVVVPSDNSAVVAPEKGAEGSKHTKYTWPTVSDVTASVVYEEVPVEEACAYTETGSTAGDHYTAATTTYTCSVCGAEYTVKADTIAPHTFANYKVTFSEDGKTATATGKCTEDDATDTVKVPVTATSGRAATAKDKGTTVYTVDTTINGEHVTGTKEVEDVDALGVKITVAANGLGYIESDSDLNSPNGAEKTATFAYGATYTVTAKAADESTTKFIGWEVNKMLVSTDATYTGTAYANLTLVPVFEETTDDSITVLFYDKYGNVVDKFVGSASDFAKREVPKASTYPGYEFKDWGMTNEEVQKITESTTLWAQYEAIVDENKGYTVTTNGDLELPDGVTNGKIPYDTQVTVSNDDATAWQIDGVTVAYGTSYTFYVGADVTVNYITEEVTKATPDVTIIKAAPVAGTGYKFNILATKTVPEGYELVDFGFVYGKQCVADDLTLDNVGNKGTGAADAGQVKAFHFGTKSGDQFALNYGLSAGTGKFAVKAFVTYKSAEGTIIKYTDEPLTVDYNDFDSALFN